MGKTTFNQEKQTVKGDQYSAGKNVNVTKTKDSSRNFENTGTIQGSNVNLGDNNTQTISNVNQSRDINFSAVQNQAEFVKELKKLQKELTVAIEQKVFADDIKFEVGSRITKAVKQAEESEPKKEGILKHLSKLEGLVAGVDKVAELAKSVKDAIGKVASIFSK